MIPMKRVDKTHSKHGSRPSFGQRIARGKPADSLAIGSTPAQTDDTTVAKPAASYMDAGNDSSSNFQNFDGGADTGGNASQMEGSPEGRQNIPPMKGRRFGLNNISRMAR